MKLPDAEGWSVGQARLSRRSSLHHPSAEALLSMCSRQKNTRSQAIELRHQCSPAEQACPQDRPQVHFPPAKAQLLDMHTIYTTYLYLN